MKYFLLRYILYNSENLYEIFHFNVERLISHEISGSFICLNYWLLIEVRWSLCMRNNCWLFVGNKPPQVHPDKRFYLPIDVRRMAKHYGLPMNDHEGEVCNVTYWSCPMRKTPRFNMEHFLGEFPYTDTQFSQCQFF